MISEKGKKKKRGTQCDLITVDLFRLSLGITNAITQVRNMRERMSDGVGWDRREVGVRLGSDSNQEDLICKQDLSSNNL